MTLRAGVFGAVLCGLLTGPAFAHHSYAMFDRGKTVTLTGAVKSFDMVQPHSWLKLAVTDPATGTWSLEMGPPGSLRRDGWSEANVQPGDTVIVKIHPLRDGSHGGQLINAKLASGKTLRGGGPEESGFGF